MFLSLPLEIRRQIYCDLFIRPTLNLCRRPNSQKLRTFNNRDSLVDERALHIQCDPISTSLLLTCKEVYTECSSILYSSNTFAFYDPKVLLIFVTQIGQKNTSNIRAIHIVVPWNEDKWALWPVELICKLSSDAQSLKTMDIVFEKIPANCFQLYGFRSQEDILNWVIGRRLSLELNLRIALRRLPCLIAVAVRGFCTEGWPEYLHERIGCKVSSTRISEIIQDGDYLESKPNLTSLPQLIW